MFRTVAGCVVVVLVMMGAGVLQAQDEPTAMPAKLALTIPEAIELAWKNNITSIRQQSALEASEAVQVGTRSTWLPSLSFDASWERSQPADVRQVLLPDSSFQTLVLSDTYRFGFSLRQPLFNSAGGSYLHVPRAAGAQVSADEELLRSTRQLVALETKRLCYNLLKAQKLFDVQGNAVKRSIEQLETSKARYELGSASMSDFLKSKVQLGSDSLTLITRANDMDIARSELNKFLALDVARPTEVDVQLDFEPYPLPSDTAVAAAVEMHPTVQAEYHKLRRAESELGGDRFQRLPSVDAFLNYGWFGSEFPGGTDEIWRTDAHSVGIQLNWKIFTGFSTSSRIRAVQGGPAPGRAGAGRGAQNRSARHHQGVLEFECGPQAVAGGRRPGRVGPGRSQDRPGEVQSGRGHHPRHPHGPGGALRSRDRAHSGRL